MICFHQASQFERALERLRSSSPMKSLIVRLTTRRLALPPSGPLRRPLLGGRGAYDRDLPQRTGTRARHDRINYSKNTERHCALAGASRTPKRENAMSTTALIRRAILAGAASITALALPALIASAPAAAAAGTRSRPILRLSTATRLGGQRLRRPKRQPAPSSPPSCIRARDVRPSPCGRFSSARLRCGPGRRARRPTRAAENGPTSHRPTREASIELWRLILRMRLANRAAREAFQPNLRDFLTISSKNGAASNRAFRASRLATTSTSSAGRLFGPMAMRSNSPIAFRRSLVAAFRSLATLLTFLTTRPRALESAVSM